MASFLLVGSLSVSAFMGVNTTASASASASVNNSSVGVSGSSSAEASAETRQNSSSSGVAHKTTIKGNASNHTPRKTVLISSNPMGNFNGAKFKECLVKFNRSEFREKGFSPSMIQYICKKRAGFKASIPSVRNKVLGCVANLTLVENKSYGELKMECYKELADNSFRTYSIYDSKLKSCIDSVMQSNPDASMSMAVKQCLNEAPVLNGQREKSLLNIVDCLNAPDSVKSQIKVEYDKLLNAKKNFTIEYQLALDKCINSMTCPELNTIKNNYLSYYNGEAEKIRAMAKNYSVEPGCMRQVMARKAVAFAYQHERPKILANGSVSGAIKADNKADLKLKVKALWTFPEVKSHVLRELAKNKTLADVVLNDSETAKEIASEVSPKNKTLFKQVLMHRIARRFFLSRLKHKPLGLLKNNKTLVAPLLPPGIAAKINSTTIENVSVGSDNETVKVSVKTHGRFLGIIPVSVHEEIVNNGTVKVKRPFWAFLVVRK